MKRFKFYLRLLCLLAITFILWWLFKDDAGYILISANSFKYESTLLLVVLFIIGLTLLWWLIKFIWLILSLSFNWLNPWNSNKKASKNSLSLEQGVISFCSDDFANASYYLNKGTSLIHQLLLTKSLINNYKYQEALNNIKQINKNPNNKLIGSILYNQVLLLKNNNQEALNNIKKLFSEYKKEPAVINLLIQSLIKTNNYDEAFNLIIKYKLIINIDDFNLIWREYIAKLSTSNLLITNWHKLANFYINDVNIISSYALRLKQLGDPSSAEQIVRKTLKRKYNSALIYIYGEINFNIDLQLKFVLSLLDQNSKDHILYLTLAKLNLQQNSAQEYLMSSIKIKKCDEAQKLLALIFIKLGDNLQAINILS